MAWETVADRLSLYSIHAALYRLLRGRLVGRHILLLGTTGRRSGRQRCTPLFYVRDGSDYVIVASNGGEERYPGWWHNIRANPRVVVQVGADVVECTAHEVRDEEVDALWPRLISVFAGYARYRERTKRPLTLFRLHPGDVGESGVHDVRPASSARNVSTA